MAGCAAALNCARGFSPLRDQQGLAAGAAAPLYSVTVWPSRVPWGAAELLRFYCRFELHHQLRTISGSPAMACVRRPGMMSPSFAVLFTASTKPIQPDSMRLVSQDLQQPNLRVETGAAIQVS